MAQQILQLGTTTIWFNDTKYKVNYDGGAVAEVVRYTNPEKTSATPVLRIFNGAVIFWIDTTGIDTPTQFLGGMRFNLP